jgi:PAS domain S-box-containing protein
LARPESRTYSLAGLRVAFAFPEEAPAALAAYGERFDAMITAIRDERSLAALARRNATDTILVDSSFVPDPIDLARRLNRLPGVESVALILYESSRTDLSRALNEGFAEVVQPDDAPELAWRRIARASQRRGGDRAECAVASFIDEIRDPVIVRDKNEAIVYVNEGGLRMSGYTQNELRGAPLSRVVGKTKGVDLFGSKDEREDRFEAELLTKGGNAIPLDVVAKPIGFRGEDATLLVCRNATERKLAELSIRRGSQRFYALAECGAFAVVVHRKQEIVYYNAVAESIVGVPRSKMRTLDDWRTTLPDESKNLFEELERSYQERYDMAPTTFELALSNARNEERHVEFNVSAIEYDGKPAQLVVFTDITDRKLAIDELRRSETQFRSVWERSFDGMRAVNEEGVVVMVNDAYCRMADKSRDELIGEHYSVIYEPDVANRFQILSDRIRTDSVEPHLERESILWNGKRVWFEISNSFIEGPAGKTLLSIFRDVTARKLAEEELKRSQDLYRTLFELIGDYAYKFRINRYSAKLEWVSDSFADVTGYSVEAAQSGEINWTNIPHPDDRQIIRERVRRMLSGNPDMREYRYVTRAGETRWARDYAQPMLDERTGEVVSIIGAVQDVTNRKNSEQRLRDYAEELRANRDQLEERAAELTTLNRRLAESEERLQKINADKDKLFSVVAHDLRSPFTGLIGYAEMLALEIDSLEPSEIKRFAGSMYRSISDIKNLIDNLLEWTRLQSGRITAAPATTYLVDAASEIVALYQSSASKKSIRLIDDVDPTLTVFADRNLLAAALRNLVGNAVKFTREGGVVRISAERGNREVVVSVADDGVGMSEERAAGIFDSANRQSSPGTADEKGSGLGLVITKEFVELNGGVIAVESAPDKGSVFRFTVPAADPKLADPNDAPA